MNPADCKCTLQTTNAKLNPLCEKDAEFIFNLLNSDGWLRFIGNRNINSLDDAKNYIYKVMANSQAAYWIVFVNMEAIGLITLIKRDYLSSPDIGFAFLPQYQQKGFAFETTNCVIDYLQREKGVSKLSAICTIDNDASIKLLEKLGFSFLQEIIVEGEELNAYFRSVAK
ncbi:MAG: GNAT family N-acetyltransferase [Bacteroidetes bacterium]|nr:GNAT family N-acetyltransferase [Bacteroidota bacterium]